MRQNPELRADRFVERFRGLKHTSEQHYAVGNYSGHRAARAELGNMVDGLQRDPQLESLLANRKRELGISFDSGMGVGRDLARTGLSRSTIYRKIVEGTFPPQIKISTNGADWKETDSNRWIANPAGWRPRSRNEFDFLNDY